jgi:hypothetical protein
MSRQFLANSLVLVLAIGARADDATELRDRVLKAAAKNPADIQKFKAFKMKAKGISKLSAEPQPANFELVAIYPGKLKGTWEFGGGENKQFVSIAASNDTGWRHGKDFPPADLSVEELNDFRSDMFGVFTSTLLTLTETDVKLTIAERAKVQGNTVVGLKVFRRPYPEMTLYFDETTYLPRKMIYRGRESGVLMTKEMIYGGHKETGGLTLPTTQTTIVQGKEIYTWTEMTFEFPDRIDLKVFEKP